LILFVDLEFVLTNERYEILMRRPLGERSLNTLNKAHDG